MQEWRREKSIISFGRNQIYAPPRLMRFVSFIELITYRWPSWWWKEHEKTNIILLSKDAAFLKLRTRVHYYWKSQGLHRDTACYFAGFSIRLPLQCHRCFDCYCISCFFSYLTATKLIFIYVSFIYFINCNNIAIFHVFFIMNL